MNDDQHADDSGLAAAASSISRGTPVDWNALAARADFSDHQDALVELRALETLALLNDPVPTTWGPFVINGEIGRGAFGVVYRALDPNLALTLALKIIKLLPSKALDPSRALAEARVLAQIVHPNVVRVHRAEQIGNEIGIAMELIRGETLATLVRQRGPYSAREATLIALDLCLALAAVHAAKVLHGDLKAHNVMRAEGGRTVLMDFGSARDLAGAITDADAVTGTPLYLAPEVFAGGPRTRASDIYSLGVLLYFLTTGSYPVGGTTRTEVERRHANGTPRRHLRDVRPDLPDAFIRVVDRALAPRPDERHQSVGELEADLNAALAAASQEPRPRPWSQTLIAAALMATVGLGTLLAWLLVPLFQQSGQAVPPEVGAVGGSAPAASTVATSEYRIHAAIFREQDGQEAPLDNGALVVPGDRLSLRITASAPIYLYVVNEDEEGESYLLFPLDGRTASSPLSAGERHRLPPPIDGERISWQVTSRGGREHFLLFASPERPSPAFERIFASLPHPVAGKVVTNHRLSREAVRALRGVGGLASSGDEKKNGPPLIRQFTVPLAPGEETVRGVWVRQVTLQNP